MDRYSQEIHTIQLNLKMRRGFEDRNPRPHPLYTPVTLIRWFALHYVFIDSVTSGCSGS